MSQKKSKPFDRIDSVFDYIVQYKLANDGNSPTIRQICSATGISSTCTARYNLEKLKSDGALDFILSEYGTVQGYKIVGGYWSMAGSS